MVNTYIKIIVIMMVAVLIAGCGNSGSSGGSSGSSNQFRGGGNFVTLELQEDAPPDFIYDSSLSLFDVSVKIENRGEWDIPSNSLRVVLTGFESDNWGNVDSTAVVSNELRGYDILYDIEGDFEFVDFKNIEYREKLTQNTYTHNFIVKSCFPYGSKVTFTACVDKDARRTTTNDDLRLCDGFSEREYSVSSGVIDVRGIEQQIVNGKLRLILSLVNNEYSNPEVEVYMPDSLDAMCSKKEGKTIQVDDSVEINLRDSTIGEFVCNGGNRVVFTSNEPVRVVCEADISNVPTQELPLVLTIEYEALKAFRDSLVVERSD